MKRSRLRSIISASAVAIIGFAGLSYGQWVRSAPYVKLQYNTDNVGIGTLTPTAKLQVRDTTTAAGTKTVFLGTTVGTSCLPAMQLSDGTNTRTVLGLRTGDIAVDNSGNVGIGASPGVSLDVVKSYATIRAMGTSNNDNVVFALYHSSGGDQIWQLSLNGSSPTNGAANKDFTIQDGPAKNYITCKSSGNVLLAPNGDRNVGIGTTTPYGRLVVSGSSGSFTSLLHGTDLAINLTGAQTDGALIFANGSTARGFIYGNSNGAMEIDAGGSNQNVGIKPSGTGYTLLYGNVGVGTTSPAALLTAKGQTNNPWLSAERNSSTTLQFKIVDAENTGYTASTGTVSPAWTNVIDNNNSNIMLSTLNSGGTGGKIILDGNSVGIGTTSPNITGWGLATTLYNSSSHCGYEIGTGQTGNGILVGGVNFALTANTTYKEVGGMYAHISGSTSGNEGLRLGFFTKDDGGTANTERLTILSNGNVGIGTTNPGYLLAVKGKIAAKEVVVTQTGWSDFVFKDNYKLKSLKQVAEYVKTNKHLEGIPTEAEVKKNGVSVGEMQAKLLEKVEELTLHMIEMKKENDELKTKVSKLEMAAKAK
jgi:hypothetical protein